MIDASEDERAVFEWRRLGSRACTRARVTEGITLHPPHPRESRWRCCTRARVHAHGWDNSTPLPPPWRVRRPQAVACGLVSAASGQVFGDNIGSGWLVSPNRLPDAVFVSLGLATVHLASRPAVKMPYFDSDSADLGARLRAALESKSRFKWRKGTRGQPYGFRRRLPAQPGWFPAQGAAGAHHPGRSAAGGARRVAPARRVGRREGGVFYSP